MFHLCGGIFACRHCKRCYCACAFAEGNLCYSCGMPMIRRLSERIVDSKRLYELLEKTHGKSKKKRVKRE